MRELTDDEKNRLDALLGGREFNISCPRHAQDARQRVDGRVMIADAAELLRRARAALRGKYINTVLDDQVARRYNEAQLLKGIVLLVEAIDEWLLRL
jgi:hypothetical protein